MYVRVREIALKFVKNVLHRGTNVSTRTCYDIIENRYSRVEKGNFCSH